MSDDFVTAREAVGQLTIGLDTDWRVQLGYRALDALARIESRLCEVEEERAVAQRGYEHFMAECDGLRKQLEHFRQSEQTWLREADRLREALERPCVSCGYQDRGPDPQRVDFEWLRGVTGYKAETRTLPERTNDE